MKFPGDDIDARVCHVYLLYVAADTPAKAKLYGLVHFNNSLGGCLCCDQKPVYSDAAHAMVYPYNKHARCYNSQMEMLRKNPEKFLYRSPLLLLATVGFDIVFQTPMYVFCCVM